MLLRNLLVSVIVLLPFPAFAARAANLVSKEFRFEGAAALSAMSVLGLSSTADLELSLPWAGSAHIRDCSYGLPPGDKSFRRCEDLSAPVNKLSYQAAPPVLVLAGTWADERTGSGPGIERYSLLSPAIGGEQKVSEGWQKLGAAVFAAAGAKTIIAQTGGAPRIGARIYKSGTDRRFSLDVIMEGTTAVLDKESDYDECLKQHPGLDGAPCN